jgi:integrase/recombinase XerD
MKKRVLLRRIDHRDASRIAMIFGYDDFLRSIARSVPGAKYSGTHKCFYVDDTEKDLRQVLSAFRDKAELDISEISASVGKIENQASAPAADKKPEATAVKPVSKNTSGSVIFRVNEDSGHLVIMLPVPYESRWVDEIRSFRGAKYDRVSRIWSLPWSKINADSLSDYFSRQGVQVELVKDELSAQLIEERKKIAGELKSRVLGEDTRRNIQAMDAYLEDTRYSRKTREAYLSMIELFLRYFSAKDPDEISGSEISAFIHDFVIGLGYSAAFHNQMISAIRIYYEVTGSGRPDIEVPGRPRRARPLPKIFSKEEVSRILNASANIKHKLLLWIIYSCGLRRSEVTNLKLSDLDRSRSILHIREGKGMVDRIVPVSDRVWVKIDEYLGSIKPKDYLFEGQSGRRYSSESVYRVFRQALKKAGIRKEVGVHSLRHSYATHLHESGLDIRYIQELLGHKSTKTTEIYTHVSRRNLIQVRSPIEDLDVK